MQRMVIGLVDNLTGSEDENILRLSTEVLVMMAVGVLQQWKAPLAYYLVGGIKSAVQATLIKQISQLFHFDLHVVGFTCDGNCYENQQTLSI
ncbi:hypothetical protein JTE90_020287 [Oedothorax gibbosus]|uniref:Transposable element P transposase-like RNase H domain-containing protein n=1 Tax=Oedothorax gibbosus TaxID=931172 RepID=A0AAV6VNS7_9ARAC|nr:hypothetical protein JTE90_020287 [Oedothorax gibbosus]